MAKSRRTTRSSRPAMGRSTRSTVEFNPDYSYVKRDLQRIGTLAGSLIALMVVLSFFIK